MADTDILRAPTIAAANIPSVTEIEGEIIYNTDVHKPQFWNGSAWLDMTGGTGTGLDVTVVDATGGATLAADTHSILKPGDGSGVTLADATGSDIQIRISNRTGFSEAVSANTGETLETALTLANGDDAYCSLDATASEWTVTKILGGAIDTTGVTYENLNTNGDVGAGTTQVARGSHLHTGVYEPVITKNSAFNKNFGITAGTVAEGNHQHTFGNLSDVSINNPTTGQVVAWNGSAWVNQDQSGTGGGAVDSVFGRTGAVVATTGDYTISQIGGAGALATLNFVSNSEWSGTDLAVVNGGTGASTASAARTNLGITPANIGAATDTHVHGIDDLSDVTISGVQTNEMLHWNGTKWVNKSTITTAILDRPAHKKQTETHTSGAYAPDLSGGHVVEVTVEGDITAINAPTNAPSGGDFESKVVFIQGTTGDHQITGGAGANVTFSGGDAKLTQGVGAKTVLVYNSSDATNWLVYTPAEEAWPAPLSDQTTDLTTGTAKFTWRAPYAIYVTKVRASVNTAPTGSTIIFDINDDGSSILGDKLSIDAGEKTSLTAAAAATITAPLIADDSELTYDIDQIGSSIAGKGAMVTFYGVRV